MMIDAKTRLAGELGWPVEHSRPPRLHNYWLDHYRIDGVYLPLPVRSARGHRGVDGLGMLLQWLGCDPEVTDALRRHVAADLLAAGGSR